MKRFACSAFLITLFAGPGLAQDSVAIDAFAAFGDAPYVFDVGEVRNRYVVDLQQITASTGTKWRVGPIAKASTVYQAGYLNSLFSAQGISLTQRTNIAFPANSYEYWTTRGAGSYWEGLMNTQPGTINTTGKVGNQFGFGFSEFGTSPNTQSMEQVVAGVVNYDPNDPYRLYVTRYLAANNAPDDATPLSQFGFGSVDSHGHVYFRAEPPSSGPANPDRLLGQNLFRVRTVDPDGAGPKQGRNAGVLNVIDLLTDNDIPSTDWLLTPYPTPITTTHGCPGNIPQQVNGTRPVLLGGNFNKEYVYESAAGTLTNDPGHLSFFDHRGQLFFSHRIRCLPNSVGTFAFIGRAATPDVGRGLNVVEIDANGNRLAKYPLNCPQYFTNLPPNNRTFGAPAPALGATVDHYRSQTAFRGGPQISLGEDAQGRALASMTLYDRTANDNNLVCPYNAIAVARWDCGGAANAQWQLAAYVCKVGSGADPNSVLDDEWDGSVYYGPDGEVWGRLAPLYAIPGLQGNVIGPSFSGSAMDSAGNIWFFSPYQRSDTLTVNSGLFRAVYDGATFSYKLELVLPFGRVIAGINSATNYQIREITIRDSNSVDSATLWAGNVMQDAWGGGEGTNLAPEDPRTLGGLVMFTQIVYDADGDGDYGDPNQPPGGPPVNTDQRYSVLLFLGPDLTPLPTGACCLAGGNCAVMTSSACLSSGGEYLGSGTTCDPNPCAPAICAGDADCDGDVDFFDIDPFVAKLGCPSVDPVACSQGCPWQNSDTDADGDVDFFDIDPFVARLGSICP